ncbi:MAG: hypothetical protein J07HQX50_02657 [Haloquadratum sp. J07HQX50]|jgi:hypothetical protein|nr:MAG: hypothetical protein J07HQX50_02657 [Haloquadratum sp. J07HQX50]
MSDLITANQGRAWGEFLFWVSFVSGFVIFGAGTIALISGGGLLQLKYFLFGIGLILFGIGSFGIQPPPPKQSRKSRQLRSFSLQSTDTYRAERILRRLAPLELTTLTATDFISRDWKIFCTGVLLLITSFGLETLGGVSV